MLQNYKKITVLLHETLNVANVSKSFFLMNKYYQSGFFAFLNLIYSVILKKFNAHCPSKKTHGN